jgi:hypothetical protein
MRQPALQRVKPSDAGKRPQTCLKSASQTAAASFPAIRRSSSAASASRGTSAPVCRTAPARDTSREEASHERPSKQLQNSRRRWGPCDVPERLLPAPCRCSSSFSACMRGAETPQGLHLTTCRAAASSTASSERGSEERGLEFAARREAVALAERRGTGAQLLCCQAAFAPRCLATYARLHASFSAPRSCPFTSSPRRYSRRARPSHFVRIICPAVPSPSRAPQTVSGPAPR